MPQSKKWRDHSGTGWFTNIAGKLIKRGSRMTSPKAKFMRKRRRKMAAGSRRRNRR
jgi:hypothetical protein